MMWRLIKKLPTLLVLAGWMGCDFLSPEGTASDWANLGGLTSADAVFSNAFQLPAGNLNPAEVEEHRLSDVAFESIFVTAPATVNSGLGPIYNQNACSSCHNKNGRAAFPTGEDLGGLLFRLSLDGTGPVGEPREVPGFGGQLQTKSVFGNVREGNVQIGFTEIVGQFPDGETYRLRKPSYTLTQPYALMPSHVRISPRIAPPIIGLGLLEAISEADILRNADEKDIDKDGISGRPNYVWSIENGQSMLGRFGWKANQPTLRQQNAAAYRDDMGITSPLYRTESFTDQPQHDGRADDPEIGERTLYLATYYTQSLAVPTARNQQDADIQKGRHLFFQIGCEHCHKSSFTTARQAPFGFLANQKIRPYTDLLLHDMGEGLADHRSDFLATGSEWRTPPLWGIGLTQVVSGHTHFLHDGRARNLQEAILWHGGEAEATVVRYKQLHKKERDLILKFLNSL